jgi:hypothetical protein
LKIGVAIPGRMCWYAKQRADDRPNPTEEMGAAKVAVCLSLTADAITVGIEVVRVRRQNCEVIIGNVAAV